MCRCRNHLKIVGVRCTTVCQDNLLYARFANICRWRFVCDWQCGEIVFTTVCHDNLLCTWYTNKCLAVSVVDRTQFYLIYKNRAFLSFSVHTMVSTHLVSLCCCSQPLRYRHSLSEGPLRESDHLGVLLQTVHNRCYETVRIIYAIFCPPIDCALV